MENIGSIVTSEAADAVAESILHPGALAFLAELHRRFNPTRLDLLARRLDRQEAFDDGRLPDFLAGTADIRAAEWLVSPAPADLRDRRVEITGPVDRKMVINGLNSGARVFMADFEDAASPTWANMIDGQANLYSAIRRKIDFTNPAGKEYRLNPSVATLMVRPRGWHLDDKNVMIDGQPVAAGLLDFGLFFFHNATELTGAGSGPYFYLPKLESHLEARLWNDVFIFAQEYLGIPKGTIKATVLIETLPAAFEMHEILYELRDHSAGLNAGRWDYIFSTIKKLRNRPGMVLPDRGAVTMTVPFMAAYADLLVATCHRRGAHAMGGMAAYIPSRRDPAVNETAFANVRADKERESLMGHDGTWVAHPDLVPLALEVFDSVLGDAPNQIQKQRPDVAVAAADLLNLEIPGGKVTEAGVRQNIDVGIRYIAAWLQGNGAAALYNLMEDTATAEISRSQIWQWIHNGARTDTGIVVDSAIVGRVVDEVMADIRREHGDDGFASGLYEPARSLFEEVALAADFPAFLTVPGYEILPGATGSTEHAADPR